MEGVAEVMMWIAYVISLYFSVFLLLVFLDKRRYFSLEDYFSQKKTVSQKETDALPQQPIVSILVPAYNEESTILKTLESIWAMDYPRDRLDVIIVNDGSTDRTGEIVEKYIADKPLFRLISHSNQGKAASLNTALAQARGEFFACLDADSFVEPKTLQRMLAVYYARNDPSLAIVTPAMKVYQPKTILQRIQWLEYIMMIFIARLSSHLDSLYVAPGPFSLYKTSIIRELGGFDPHTLTEDQEIAYRIQKQQLRIKHCPHAYVYTSAPATVKPFYQQRRRWYLGSILCLHQYKSMVGNRRYGDFGMMQMIKNVAACILSITGVVLAVYMILTPVLRHLKDLFLVKFNILPYLLSLRLHFSLLNLLATDFKLWFVIGNLVLLSACFFYLAHKNAEERILKFGWIPLLPYAVFYYLLKGCILLVSLTQFSYKKKIRW